MGHYECKRCGRYYDDCTCGDPPPLKREAEMMDLKPYEETKTYKNTMTTCKPFELARATGAPIVPMVILGADRLMPYGRYWSAPGRVVVRVLPPRDTSRFTEADLRAEAEALREVYRAEMRAFAG